MSINEHIITFGFYLNLTLSICVFSVSVLATLPYQHYIFRMWEFPRLQILVVATLSLFLSVIFHDSFEFSTTVLLIVVNIAVIVYQFIWIYPYTSLSRKSVSDARDKPSLSLKILTSNVLKTNRNSGKLVHLVEEYCPDILVTLESDKWWQGKLDEELIEYKYRIAVPLDNLYGMHVYSKVHLSEINIKYVIKDDIPSITCQLKQGSNEISMFFVHPEPPSPTEAETAKPRDKELIYYAKQAKDINGPVIVTGDLNDVAWSPTTRKFLEISALLDPRQGRGMFNTFNSNHWWARWPLDHVFVSHHFKVRTLKRLESIGSDHFPLFVELELYEN